MGKFLGITPGDPGKAKNCERASEALEGADGAVQARTFPSRYFALRCRKCHAVVYNYGVTSIQGQRVK